MILIYTSLVPDIINPYNPYFVSNSTLNVRHNEQTAFPLTGLMLLNVTHLVATGLRFIS